MSASSVKRKKMRCHRHRVFHQKRCFKDENIIARGTWDVNVEIEELLHFRNSSAIQLESARPRYFSLRQSAICFKRKKTLLRASSQLFSFSLKRMAELLRIFFNVFWGSQHHSSNRVYISHKNNFIAYAFLCIFQADTVVNT